MPKKRSSLLVLVAGLALLAACGSDNRSLTGVWTGAFADTLGGNGGGNLTFTQSGPLLEGTWQVVFNATSRFNRSGSLAGTVEGNTITATLTSGPCSFALTATRTGERIRGTYAPVSCSVAQTGAVDLEKRS